MKTIVVSKIAWSQDLNDSNSFTGNEISDLKSFLTWMVMDMTFKQWLQTKVLAVRIWVNQVDSALQQ